MWQRALNGILPPDISVIKTEKVPQHFHSRYSAIRKCYQYTILNRSFPSPFSRNHAWCIFSPLNVSKMRKGADMFKGKHDFNSFRSSSCNAKHTLITLRRLDIDKKGEFIFLTFEARSFLMHMVRHLVGYLVTLGQEKITLKDLKGFLNGSFQKHSQTAPPHGLCLLHVKYPK
jgi:tRNA pseudouridine38-40 synthase